MKDEGRGVRCGVSPSLGAPAPHSRNEKQLLYGGGGSGRRYDHSGVGGGVWVVVEVMVGCGGVDGVPSRCVSPGKNAAG